MLLARDTGAGTDGEGQDDEGHGHVDQATCFAGPGCVHCVARSGEQPPQACNQEHGRHATDDCSSDHVTAEVAGERHQGCDDPLNWGNRTPGSDRSPSHPPPIANAPITTAEAAALAKRRPVPRSDTEADATATPTR